MNWKHWNQKSTERLGQKIRIPRERVLEVKELCDIFNMAPGNAHGAGCRLWQKVVEIVPETQIGNWRIVHQNHLNCYVVEVLPPES